MAKFQYKGKGSTGVVTGTIEASSESLAADVLARRSIVPISITEVKQDAKKAGTNNKASTNVNIFTRQVDLADLVIFSRQMYALTKSGIPMMRAIVGLADTTQSVRLKFALTEIAAELEKGRQLSTAMAAHPKIFSRLFVSLVNVGENTGQLEETFLQLATYLEREQETRKSISAAMRYPTFVLFAIGVAMVVMNMFVIPTFADMFKKFNAELPWATQVLLTTSEFFLNYWWAMLLGIIFAIVGFSYWKKTEKGRRVWDKFKLNVPIVSTIIERATLSRYARSFGLMLRAGVPLTQALGLVSEAVDNAYMGDRILDMRRGIERGDSLLRTSNASELFTPLVLQMVSVGEETGRIDEMLAEVADYYEREVDYDLKSLTAKIEPILIGVVAGMVLILALGIFMPMWDMMNAYKGR
ncbi:type II secretion system F family protein [Catenovulum sp. SM1970]|uniref:type II secretion system F family protein n=1 Tax=Marinifaba aquimaris TaxID=2741323 RepID=UPI001571FF93|nr:type II secretion system F family protein [Marinifaba aquimaris]NTS75863.1 type II secretion system F family protein [Marinifaba aquimaris]